MVILKLSVFSVIVIHLNKSEGYSCLFSVRIQYWVIVLRWHGWLVDDLWKAQDGVDACPGLFGSLGDFLYHQHSILLYQLQLLGMLDTVLQWFFSRHGQFHLMLGYIDSKKVDLDRNMQETLPRTR